MAIPYIRVGQACKEKAIRITSRSIQHALPDIAVWLAYALREFI